MRSAAGKIYRTFSRSEAAVACPVCFGVHIENAFNATPWSEDYYYCLDCAGRPKKGRPLIENRDKTIEATKPWLNNGMSRATWYRRRAEKARGNVG